MDLLMVFRVLQAILVFLNKAPGSFERFPGSRHLRFLKLFPVFLCFPMFHQWGSRDFWGNPCFQKLLTGSLRSVTLILPVLDEVLVYLEFFSLFSRSPRGS